MRSALYCKNPAAPGQNHTREILCIGCNLDLSPSIAGLAKITVVYLLHSKRKVASHAKGLLSRRDPR
jgi:hypothetical protein